MFGEENESIVNVVSAAALAFGVVVMLIVLFGVESAWVRLAVDPLGKHNDCARAYVRGCGFGCCCCGV